MMWSLAFHLLHLGPSKKLKHSVQIIEQPSQLRSPKLSVRRKLSIVVQEDEEDSDIDLGPIEDETDSNLSVGEAEEGRDDVDFVSQINEGRSECVSQLNEGTSEPRNEFEKDWNKFVSELNEEGSGHGNEKQTEGTSEFISDALNEGRSEVVSERHYEGILLPVSNQTATYNRLVGLENLQPTIGKDQIQILTI